MLKTPFSIRDVFNLDSTLSALMFNDAPVGGYCAWKLSESVYRLTWRKCDILLYKASIFDVASFVGCHGYSCDSLLTNSVRTGLAGQHLITQELCSVIAHFGAFSIKSIIKPIPLRAYAGPVWWQRVIMLAFEFGYDQIRFWCHALLASRCKESWY